MHAATTRTIIAAAALTAAGLMALPQHATPQPATPTVSRQVALVDTATDVVDSEIQADNGFWNAVLGTGGAEEQLYNALGSNAPTLLDTIGAEPAYSGVFNGAESRFTEALFVDSAYFEDQLDKVLGLSNATTQGLLANDITNVEFVPIPHSLTDFSLTPGPDFDTQLLTLANAEMTTGFNDLLGYGAYEAGNLGLGSLF